MKKILIVEDDDATRNLLGIYLTEFLNQDVTLVKDEGDALKLIQSVPFDLYLVDFYLGNDNCQKFIESIPDKSKLVVMTGLFDLRELNKIIGLGYIIRKPFDLESIDKVVAN